MKTHLVTLGAVALVIAACGSEGEQSAESQGAVVRQAAVACPEISGSVTQSTRNTTFTVSSKSKRDWRLRATDIDCYDWSGVSTPSTLDGVVAAGTSVSTRIEARGACPGTGLPIPMPDRQGRFTLVLERADDSGLTAKIPIVYQCENVDGSTGSGTYCDTMVYEVQPVVTDIVDANGVKKGLISGTISCSMPAPNREAGELTFRDIP
jgi:hypothetical protein